MVVFATGKQEPVERKLLFDKFRSDVSFIGLLSSHGREPNRALAAESYASLVFNATARNTSVAA